RRPADVIRTPAGRGGAIDRGDGADIGLELERVGDLRVAREHLGHAQNLYHAARRHPEASHLAEVEGRAEAGAGGERDREGERLLEPAPEPVVREGALDRLPD